MNKYGFREPSWRDLLAEPIIQDVMKRDRVEAAQVIQLLDKLRQHRGMANHVRH